jgi:hypothetical protein
MNSTKPNPKYCAPGRGDSISCFSQSSLEKIAYHWNEKYPNNTVQIIKNKGVLWKRLAQKFRTVAKCPNEWCWVDADFLNDLNDDEIKSNTFRPKMPFTWKKNSKLWLNTLDIGAVLHQYHQKYPDFEFIGPVPLDFDTKAPGSGRCVVEELCKLNIEKLVRSGKNRMGVVFNFDPHTKQGSHWVAMFADFRSGGIYYFDSYGYKPKPEIAELLKRIHSQGNQMIYKQGVAGLQKMRDTHTVACNVKSITPEVVKFECLEFVKGLHVGDLVGAAYVKKIGKHKQLCKHIHSVRFVKAIDHRKKLVTLDAPLTDKCNVLVHKGFKIYVNKNRHQFKHSECGTYAIHFIARLLLERPFKEVSGKIILDDDMRKHRTYFYRPNMDSKNEDWLSILNT